ncbi:hypothetical protein H671_2g6986 [Cricetulus griseus]|nr:hypothetical protein H671_2g6986 [Cricetulus griseus]
MERITVIESMMVTSCKALAKVPIFEQSAPPAFLSGIRQQPELFGLIVFRSTQDLVLSKQPEKERKEVKKRRVGVYCLPQCLAAWTRYLEFHAVSHADLALLHFFQWYPHSKAMADRKDGLRAM